MWIADVDGWPAELVYTTTTVLPEFATYVSFPTGTLGHPADLA